MFIRSWAVVAALTFSAGVASAATPAPKAALSPFPTGAEVAFVTSIQKDLSARFPTPQAAEQAGYFRYTNEDEDGAISYANLHWQSASPQQPSQLWYDVHGNLLGADFSVLQSNSPAPPNLWGVNYRRWISFREHVHYILVGPNGTETYGATGAKKFAAAGGNVDDPQAATVVKMGVVNDVSAVKRVFLFPSLWDLIVWVKPNPNGAFAMRNPLVIPSANAEKDDM
ncbi:MAG: hypothetical protein JOY69_03095 [Candidatus Eremiobacteraeota bacterium]|nr:hypothetical protein [Candidatus Eremiobacteraeota bacterium]